MASNEEKNPDMESSKRVRADEEDANKVTKLARLYGERTKLIDLPNDVLHKILDEMEVYELKAVRTLCFRFRDVVDEHIMHNFKKTCIELQQNDAESNENAVHQTLNRCTQIFWTNSDLAVQHFSGTIISFMWLKRPVATGCPNIDEFGTFVAKFYDLVQIHEVAQISNLYGSLTLLHMIRSFSDVEITVLKASDFNYLIHVVIDGGFIKASGTNRLNEQLFDLLIVLAQLSLAAKQGVNFEGSWGCELYNYVYGYKLEEENEERPFLELDIYLRVNRNMGAVFTNMLEDEIPIIKLPKDFCIEDYSMVVNVMHSTNSVRKRITSFGPVYGFDPNGNENPN